MKKLAIFMAFAALLTVSCDTTEFVCGGEQRDPNDVSGIYDVTYRMWVDGAPVFFGATHGRMEVSRHDYPDKFRLDFYPDNAAIALPPYDYDTPRESMWLGYVEPTVASGVYTFDDPVGYSVSGVQVAEHHTVSCRIASINGSIARRSTAEIAATAGAETALMRPYFGDATPGLYHRLDMTFEMEVLNPKFPTGVSFDPKTGLPIDIPFDPEVGPAFYTYRFEVASR